jgi:3'-5' exoribonuclease
MVNNVQSRVKISDVKVKEGLESTFLVKYIQVNEARDGKNYLNLVMTDASGDLESRIWNNAHDIAAVIDKGDYVRANGRVNSFQGRKQFIISKIKKIEASEINPADYLATAARDSEEMFSELLSIVADLKDFYLRSLLENILNDVEIQRRLKSWQAGKSIHHAYAGGLLEHILSCSQLGVYLSKQYKVNSSYVLAGCILHDLCKIYELSDGLNVEYTEEGRLVGHLVKGVEVVDRFSYKIKNFPHSMKLHLKHILLSHHGEYAYGSPKIPQTKEAMLVHMIDLMDSKMGIFDEIIKRDNTAGHWSGFVKHMDRIIFKDELPTFSHEISDDFQIKKTETKKTETKKTETKNIETLLKKPREQGELKQSLGGLLKGFKVNGDD